MGTFKDTAFLGSRAHVEPIQTSRTDLLNLTQSHTGLRVWHCTLTDLSWQKLLTHPRPCEGKLVY